MWGRLSVLSTKTYIFPTGTVAAAGPVVSLPPSDVQPPGLPIGGMDCLYHSALSVPRASTMSRRAVPGRLVMPGVLLVRPPKDFHADQSLLP